MKTSSRILTLCLASLISVSALAPMASAAGFSGLSGLFGQNGGVSGIYVTEKGLIEHIADPTERTVTNNIAGIKAFADKYPSSHTYVSLVPTAAGIYRDFLPLLSTSFDQQEFLASTYATLPEGASAISLFEPLQANRDTGLYYGTDHHWTTDTAYLAYQKIVSDMGITPLPKEDFAFQSVSDTFLGTLARASGLSVKPDTILAPDAKFITSFYSFDGANEVTRTSPYFPEFLEGKDQYSYFLGENRPIVKIKTTANSGKTLLLFKDSYAHCLVPMLAAHFDEIALVDLRYINGGLTDFVDLTAYDTTLFLYNADVFAHQYNPAKLKSMLA